MVGTLARLHRYAEAHHESVSNIPPLTIAISRQAGSRGAEVARALADRLGWPVFDQELLARIAEEKGLHQKLLENLDERHVSWLEEVMDSFSSAATPGESAYVRHLLELFASLSRAGHCVIVGRGAGQVLPKSSTLRVRVVAPREDRVREVEKRQVLPTAEAGRWVDRRDRERARFVKECFHADVNDPLGYDLVLNSSRFTTEECAEVIAEAARKMEANMRQARMREMAHA